jgi:hypothetical protein
LASHSGEKNIIGSKFWGKNMIDSTFLEKNIIGSTFWEKIHDRQHILGKKT